MKLLGLVTALTNIIIDGGGYMIDTLHPKLPLTFPFSFTEEV